MASKGVICNDVKIYDLADKLSKMTGWAAPAIWGKLRIGFSADEILNSGEDFLYDHDISLLVKRDRVIVEGVIFKSKADACRAYRVSWGKVNKLVIKEGILFETAVILCAGSSKKKIPSEKIECNTLLAISDNEMEQIELESFYTKTKTKAEIIRELENLRECDPEEILVKQKKYRRDNKTIAQLKILRDFKCQICSKEIKTKGGGRYIEAAHIKPKCKRGCETPDNILILCPNHHKEFDYGELEIKSHNKATVEFILNGVRYELNLSIQEQ